MTHVTDPSRAPWRLLAAAAHACGGCVEDSSYPEAAPAAALPDGYGQQLAGRGFTASDGTHHTVADLEHVALRWTLDVPAHLATAHAEIAFHPVEDGVPFFLLTPVASHATLDGIAIELATLRDPDNVVTLTSMGAALTAGTAHVLALDYTLEAAQLSATGVEFATRMLDAGANSGFGSGAHFFERYGPSSTEGDAFQLSLELQLVGATAPHQLYSNGRETALAPGHWAIEFPDTFTSSSFFLHLSETPWAVARGQYAGLERAIPLVVYGPDQGTADTILADLPRMFDRLEAAFGPYMHASFIAALDIPGGEASMEHAGATFSDGFLEIVVAHELCHSWFARGVIPADGRSGWIDEGVCKWHDQGFERATTQRTRPRTDLTNESIWELATAGLDPHRDGAALFSEIDAALAGQGGLLPILHDIYRDWHGTAITTEQFLARLQASTKVDLGNRFARYVYGL